MNFALLQAEERVAHALALIESGDVHTDLEKEVQMIESAIERLRSSGASESEIQKLQGKLDTIRGEGLAALQREAIHGTAQKTSGEKGVSDAKIVEAAKDGLARESANRAVEVLTTPGHWAHQTFKNALFRVIETAGKIPDEYKATLTEDTAMLLRVCPKAGGLVAAMLTRGQPQGSFTRRLQTKGNDAVGAAYEIMGTAALCRGVSKAANTKHLGRALHIDPVRDKLVFGPKSYLNHRYDDTRKVSDRQRRSVEADAQFRRKESDGSFSEVAIDFKHVKEGQTKQSSNDLLKQIDAVADQIAGDVYQEFHFVTNGRFSEKIMQAIDSANERLLHAEQDRDRNFIKEGGSGRDLAMRSEYAKIIVHHHVTSIQNDPFSNEEVT
jgi:hypothetical protein